MGYSRVVSVLAAAFFLVTVVSSIGQDTVAPGEGVLLEPTDLIVAIPPSPGGGGMAWVEVETTLRCAELKESQWLHVSVDEPLPLGLWLEVEVWEGLSGMGYRPLTSQGSLLAFRLPGRPVSLIRLRYRFRHDVTAPVGRFSRTVLFTLLDP